MPGNDVLTPEEETAIRTRLSQRLREWLYLQVNAGNLTVQDAQAELARSSLLFFMRKGGGIGFGNKVPDYAYSLVELQGDKDTAGLFPLFKTLGVPEIQWAINRNELIQQGDQYQKQQIGKLSEQQKSTMNQWAQQNVIIPEAKRQSELETDKWSTNTTGLNQMLPQTGTNQKVNFEVQRQTQVTQLDQPRDWISRWMAQNSPNPYDQRITTTSEFFRTQAELRGLEQLAESYKPDPHQSPWSDYNQAAAVLPQLVEQARANHQMWSMNLATDKANIAQQGDIAGTEGTPNFTRSQIPPTPSWLLNITNAPIQDKRVQIPSMQQWSALEPSQQEMYKGYLDYSNVYPQDIISQMQKMQPETPYGAGWARRTPVRQ